MGTIVVSAMSTSRLDGSPLGNLVSPFLPLRSRWMDAVERGTLGERTLAPAPPAIHGALRNSSTVMATSTTTVTDSNVIERVHDLYALRGIVAVLRVLREQPDVAALLLEAFDWLASSFVPHPNVVLEVVTDPGDEDDPGTLYAFIQTALEPEQVRPQMRHFRDHWWTEASIRAHGRLNFGLEYI